VSQVASMGNRLSYGLYSQQSIEW